MKQELAKAAYILRKVKQPNISNEVARLQEESLKDDPDVVIIAECISRNAKLFTKFLGIASFLTKGEVRTAREAVDILGTKNIFNLFFSSAIEFSFQDSGFNAHMVNHAIKIAIAMSDLAKSVKNVHSGDAYLFGLLNNVGFLVLNRYDHRFYKTIYLESLLNPAAAAEKEMAMYGTNSACIGVYIAKKWHVKNAIYSGILFQDKPVRKCPDGVNLAFEMVNLLHIARSVVSQTEDQHFVTEELRNQCTLSMQTLGISHKAFINAQRRVRIMSDGLKFRQDESDEDKENEQAS